MEKTMTDAKRVTELENEKNNWRSQQAKGILFF